MKLILGLLVVLVASFVGAMPFGEDTYSMQPSEVDDDAVNTWLEEILQENTFDQMHQRHRRSPQNGKHGSVVVSGSRTEGRGGAPAQQSVRGEYNHNLWRGRNGATVDANAYYQRNWGAGPRHDYGGGIRATIPFGRR
ncbi:uncharacterized protein LOC111051695 [Nilaparvata lugens]|uniref:uncharacterized protein LOC111051695 n=1 Tax=Nilaparvata lugens TaxID=108931 RepID=UPI000B9818D6|nr:uncharacterized protein LOC111051695 [Nilaparvata lugens]XP_039283881.1 uncharacterized protein LOC111051695 [Nilaparvata lugens]